MSKRLVTTLAAGLGLTVAAGLPGWAVSAQSTSRVFQPPTTPSATPISEAPIRPGREDLRRQARARALALLDQADAEAQAVVSAQVQQIEAFFAAARGRLPALADEALGWSGRWRLVADHVPLAGSGRRQAFLNAAIARRLFTAEQLEQQAHDALAAYLTAERDVEDRLLVQLRQDLADFAAPVSGMALDADLIEAALNQVVVDAATQAGAGLRADAARELASLAAGEVLARLAVRAVVPAGLTASAPAAWGVGLAAALAADRALVWAWGPTAGPRKALLAALTARLDGLRQAVIEGSSNAPGLRPHLERLASERATLRRAAVLQAVDQAGGAP